MEGGKRENFLSARPVRPARLGLWTLDFIRQKNIYFSALLFRKKRLQYRYDKNLKIKRK